jgi:hypothetical protein
MELDCPSRLDISPLTVRNPNHMNPTIQTTLDIRGVAFLRIAAYIENA